MAFLKISHFRFLLFFLFRLSMRAPSYMDFTVSAHIRPMCSPSGHLLSGTV